MEYDTNLSIFDKSLKRFRFFIDLQRYLIHFYIKKHFLWLLKKNNFHLLVIFQK